MKPKIFFLVCVLAVLLMGCQGPQAVVNGSVTDIITNVEPRASGFSIIWVKTDITSGYCTDDASVIADATLYKEFAATVTISYKSINLGEHGSTLTGASGCDPEGEGIRTYWLNSMRLAFIETTKTPPWSRAQ
jgi:hypothetical protein